MNIRNVLRTYGLLRQLTDDETALLETLRAMTDGEREQLVESLAPTKPAKKSRKPRGRSVRAVSLAGAISGTTNARCSYPNCNDVQSSAVHSDPTFTSHHEFQPPVRAAASGDGG